MQKTTKTKQKPKQKHSHSARPKERLRELYALVVNITVKIIAMFIKIINNSAIQTLCKSLSFSTIRTDLQ